MTTPKQSSALPVWSQSTNEQRRSSKQSRSFVSTSKILLVGAGALVTYFVVSYDLWSSSHHHTSQHVPLRAHELIAECAQLRAVPGPSKEFVDGTRMVSDRYEASTHGSQSQLIANATIWTGRKDGTQVIHGDILLQDGLIKAVGKIPAKLIREAGANLVRLDAGGAWVTPGIFDIHSHIGVDGVPELRGGDDTNSIKGLALPWLRSMDGINVYDEALKLSVAGGVTTSLILPGSADAIGGQAFVIKLRPTAEGSPMSMVLEPPFALNSSTTKPTDPPHWRHMKHATGENPSRVYQGTRMDTMWAFREAYEEARKVMKAQDEYCVQVESRMWKGLAPEVPKSLKWEALVDVLRGKVKVNIHSYTPQDFDGLIRLSNEFKFHIAAIHHAHTAYLVPELLEKFYGGKPAVALFATNARYKQEAYRGSEFAPKILNDAGFKVSMKSDHPVLNSRFLLYEAAQAHLYGLPANKAIQSVTTTPAAVAGFGHRLGYVAPGYDADIVVWDSHPLALGATPQQVYIDGIPQIAEPVKLSKPAAFQDVPKTPDWKKEAEAAIKYHGLPPLKSDSARNVAFINIRSVWLRDPDTKQLVESHTVGEARGGTMQFNDGALLCSSFHGQSCLDEFDSETVVVDLEGGSMGPGLTSIGGALGVMEIDQEPSTNDGYAFGPFDKEFAVVGDLSRAADGLSFEGRDMMLAYRAGVTNSVASPLTKSMISGLSVAFSNGASHSLEDGAIIKGITALHIKISPFEKQPSVSTQIGLLRTILLSTDDSKVTAWFKKVVGGELPLIVHTNSADVMAKILILKAEVEGKLDKTIKLAFFGGLEAHLLAKEISAAGVSVIVSPSRSFPAGWDARRTLPGPPLTQDTVISTLVAANVTTAIGIVEGWEARNTRFDLAWASLEANGRINKEQAIALASTNLEKIFGIEPDHDIRSDWVAYRGGDLFDFGSKVVAVVSQKRARVDVFDA